jgi:hypothetical protein
MEGDANQKKLVAHPSPSKQSQMKTYTLNTTA